MSDLELLVTYDDRSINYVPVSEDMVSSEDLAKLKTVGIHTFTINYKGLKVEATVDLVEEPKDPIKEVRLSVNNKKYEAESLEDMYKATCNHDAQYIYVTVTVTLLLGYSFDKDGVDLYINDKLIDPTKYTIDGNVITYKYKDPNWSPIL